MAYLIPASLTLLGNVAGMPCPCGVGSHERSDNWRIAAVTLMQFGAIYAGHLIALNIAGFAVSPLAMGIAGTAIISGIFISIYFNRKRPIFILAQIIGAIALAGLSYTFTTGAYNIQKYVKADSEAREVAKKLQTETHWYKKAVEFHRNHHIALRATTTFAERNSLLLVLFSAAATSNCGNFIIHFL